MRRAASLLLAALLGCGRTESGGRPAAPLVEAAAPPSAAAVAPGAVVTVTVLYTSDEHGWVQPFADGGPVHAGAAAMLGQWEAVEGHCPGPPPPGEPADPTPRQGCAAPSTLVLSGGDNFTGPAVSTYYQGEPMADAMARMGYAASALGNHEIDFGPALFPRDAARAGLTYLAANVVVGPSRSGTPIAPFAIFERRGVKIGVVGLATETTLSVAMPGNFEGLRIDREEPALDAAVTQVWGAGADAVVVIAHECAERLKPLFERHPGWGVSFIGAGHCHKIARDEVGGVPLLSPGWRLEHYARVKLGVDRARPARSRVVSVSAELVDNGPAAGAPAPSPIPPRDEPLAHAMDAWQRKVDAALGEPIGYTATGFDRDAPELRRWVTTAWRRVVGGDVGIVNNGGIRQSVPKGTLTKATIWGVLPFDNRLMVLRLDGKALSHELENKEACASGVVRAGPLSFKLEKTGAPLAEGQSYQVIVTDFAYLGGSRFTFKEHDAAPRETGTNWRDPVITWTQSLRTSAADPLEKHLD